MLSDLLLIEYNTKWNYREIRECSKPPNDNALKVSSKQQSLEKLKTTNDDLLELLSGVNISQQWHSSGFASSEQSLVPPMQVTNVTKNKTLLTSFSKEGKFPQQLPFRETLQQQWHDVDTPSQFENLQVRGMNMTSMFPTRQGIIFPNMIMTPYMTYGGPGTWSGMYICHIIVWKDEHSELFPGNLYFISSNYSCMGPRTPGTDKNNANMEYDVEIRIEFAIGIRFDSKEMATHGSSRNFSQSISSDKIGRGLKV
ncbi:uncharacterized protein Gasu_27590 [Galdieria sulphuraria]|uniref:Uncharacterized protein n=1 Tax=Galdieria sulphuraria TaxID=130081 RepID=M2XIQ5_GALSU|nr:uncharacterized protein Gasu_27590 [Galdieria sulphuraria]EME29977.1 hypothetical protein Gasu_27590 [Galdieria sulphuraria]|eukprot:XP_005706497.1 hypothetical protein Gasu_27590 [Galdieria sulphuraria]